MSSVERERKHKLALNKFHPSQILLLQKFQL